MPRINSAADLTNPITVDARTYKFVRINGGRGASGVSGNLSSAGSGKVLTFTSMPSGLAVGNYVYIVGGTGTAEAVAISAVTTSTDGSGTITVTTANTHTGSWRVTSATSGIQEAASAITNGTIHIAAGQRNVYALSTFTGHIYLRGDGMDSTKIVNKSTSTGVFLFSQSASMGTTLKSAAVHDLSIYGGTVANFAADYCSATAIQCSTGNHGFVCERVFVSNHNIGIYVLNTWGASVIDCYILHTASDGVYNEGSEVTIRGGQIQNNGTTGTVTVSSSGVRARNCLKMLMSDVLIGVKKYGFLGEATSGFSGPGMIQHCDFDSCELAAVALDGSGAGTLSAWHFSDNWVSYAGTNGVSYIGAGKGYLFSGANIKDVQVNGGWVRECGGHGVSIEGGTDIHIKNVLIGRNSQLTNNTYAGVLVAAGVSKWSVKNCDITDYASTAANGQYAGILVAAGASNNYEITGNNLRGNQSVALEDNGTGTNKIIANNAGVDDAAPIVRASAASIALPTNGSTFVEVTGTATITTVTGGRKGQTYRLRFSNAAPGGVGTGGNIARTQAAVQNQVLTLTFDGTTWY